MKHWAAIGAGGVARCEGRSTPRYRSESQARPLTQAGGRRWRAATAPVENVAVAAAPSRVPDPGSADADLQRIKTASATRPDDGGGDSGMLADLPLEMRLQVQGLLVDLDAKLDDRGLMMTVPGALLFAVNSDEVRADRVRHARQGRGADRHVRRPRGAHRRPHRRRSATRRTTRRSRNAGPSWSSSSSSTTSSSTADRLSTEGQGEARPIASNATPQGRPANRRVEVLILN